MNMKNNKLNEENMKKVSGGTSSTIKAVGSTIRVSGLQTICPGCGGPLIPQRYSTDNGRTAYNGQECSKCGKAFIYGDNIM